MAVQDVDANVDLVAPWYEPSTERIDASQIEQFRRWLQDQGHSAPNQRALHQWSIDAPEQFWSCLWRYFDLPSTSTPALSDAPVPVRPGIRWFPDVQVNYTGELFARQHQMADETALIGVAEDGGVSTLSWAELRLQVARLASWLRSQQVGPGDRVVAYLPDIPEATVAFLATAAVGAVWSACGQDYAPTAALARLGQLDPKVLIASSGYDYAGRYRARMAESDEIRQGLPDLQTAILIGASDANWTTWSDVIGAGSDMGVPALTTEPVAFDHPLWVLFSSGTTGKPKGIMHGHGGVLLEHVKMLAFYADVDDTSIFWWQTSPSWMMWNYRTSALLLGATVLSYSGSPSWPGVDRIWRIAAEHRVTYLGISPAYIVACRQAGIEPRRDLDLSTLRMIGSTGAPLPADAYHWIETNVAPGVPISSITGGTDVVTAFAAASPADQIWAGEISGACLGADLRAFDSNGESLVDELGELVLASALPSMPVAFWEDPDGSRLNAAYFERYPGVWCHGDWVTITNRGTLLMHGRSDSTLNKNGVRMGSSEVYAAIERLPQIRDGLIIGVDKADGSYWMPLFVQLTDDAELDEELRKRIATVISEQASPRHVPDEVIAVPGIPRTRTGKRLEVPIKRMFAGIAPDQAVDRNAVDDVAALEWFIHYAAAD